MSRLYVPTLGTRLCLLADWTFPLFVERRNLKLIQTRFPACSDVCWANDTVTQAVRWTWPAGTVLCLQRIYVKRCARDFDSLTFSVATSKATRRRAALAGGVFWVRLRDANRIEYDVVE